MVLTLWPPLAAALAPDQAFHQFMKDTWSIQEGLPQITVTDVVQGPDHYIWAATQAGVARFDGVRFTTFTPDNTPEMPGMFVNTLFVDSQDRIWIGTYRGAAYYDGRRFHHVDDEQGRSFDLYQFAENDEQWVLAATARGLLRTRGDRLQQFDDDPTESLLSVFHRDGMSLAGGRGVIYRNDGDGWQRTELAGMPGVPVTGFARYDDTEWAATGQGLMRWTGTAWQSHFDSGPLADRVIEAMYLDRDNNFWVSVAGALVRIRDREAVEVIPDDAPDAVGNVLSMTEDHEGNLWLGGRWTGLTRLWDSWVLRYDRPEGLHNSLTWAVAGNAEGDLLVGTMDGLARFRQGRFDLLVPGAELPHPHAYTLLVEDHRVWIGTRAGLAWWDPQRHRLIPVPPEFQALAGVQVNGILRRSDGEYWMPTSIGVWRWDGTTLEQVELEGENGDWMARTILETDSGQLLIGTVRGLFRHRSGERLQRETQVPDSYDVTALVRLTDGRIVAGTLDERLLIKDNGLWHDFGIEDGLPVNSAFAFAEMDDSLWVAGIRGIYELPIAAVNARLAGKSDQLPGRMVLHERGDVSGAQTGFCCNGAGNSKGLARSDGFWLPTRGGIVRLEPERIKRNTRAPMVRVERVRVQGQWMELADAGPLRLSRHQRDLAFGFTVLSFQDPGSVQLQYRLLGYNDQWQEVDDPGQRLAFYTNLPAGDFTLEVRGSNNANVWSTSTAALELNIAPRLRETTTFWLLVASAIVALAWLTLTFRLRSLKAQRAALEQIVAERTRALSRANDDLRQYSHRLKEASLTDHLTGLWNRRYLVSQLPADLAHFRREMLRPGNEDHVLLFGLLDIDHFKSINDLRGHSAGDAVLQQLATLLSAHVREGDYVVRWGGEEFLLVFRPMPSDQPTRVAERIRAAVAAAEFQVDDGEPLHISCSIGLAEYPVLDSQPEAFSWEDVGGLADVALYHVKHNGRNGWCLVRACDGVTPERLKAAASNGLDQMLVDGLVTIETLGRSKPSC